MMSVFIKGMKMPKNCDKCPCCCDLGCAVKLITMTTKQMSENRPDWCPLVELPSGHGRLIDAEKMCEDIATVDTRYEQMIEWCIIVTKAQPTVIESEGEE